MIVHVHLVSLMRITTHLCWLQQVAASPTVTVVRESDIDPAWIEKEKLIEAQAEDLRVRAGS